MRMVSGPQGPRVVLDGRPVLLLCSGNALGLADHPKVRQAAADAAMRWGVGAGAARVSSGTMTLHRRLEERLAAFTGQRAALLFGSGAMANMGVIAALARRGEVVLHDELSHSSIVDGCRLSGADIVAYRHADPEHLAWTLRQCDGRATLIATDGMFGMDGDVAPLRGDRRAGPPLRRRACWSTRRTRWARSARAGAARSPRPASRARSTSSPARWARRSAPTAASSACDHVTARFLVHSARTLLYSTALPPVAAAAAMAALDLLEEQPRRVDKLRANAEALRDGLAREGFEVAAPPPRRPARRRRRGPRLPDRRPRARARRLRRGRPPTRRPGGNRPRAPVGDGLPHPQELRGAATALGRAALRAGFRPGAGLPVAAAQAPSSTASRPRPRGLGPPVRARVLPSRTAGQTERVYARGTSPRSASWPRQLPASEPRARLHGHRRAARRPARDRWVDFATAGWPRGSRRSARPSRPRCARPARGDTPVFLHDRYHRVRPLFARRGQA